MLVDYSESALLILVRLLVLCIK